jgi:hypothetical protein
LWVLGNWASDVWRSLKHSLPGGIERAGAGRPRSFPLSDPYSALVAGVALVVVSSMAGTLSHEVMIAATFSVSR